MSSNRPRLLICRLSALGDCILSMPLACALRDHLPEAEITWVAQPGPAKLLRHHPCVDHVVEVPRGWLKQPSQVLATRRALRAQRIECSIDPQSLTKSATAGWLSGAKKRIGFRSPQGREMATWLNNLLVARTATHVVDGYLQLLEPLGITNPKVRFDFPSRPADQPWLNDQLSQLGLSPGYVVLNPGAGWDSKLWPADRYAAVARYLDQQLSRRSLVVWAGARERAWAQQIVDESAGATVMAPETDLFQLAAMLRGAALFIGSDTGPLHMAAAVGTRCISLHGTTQASDCGAYGPQHVCLQTYYQSGTSRQRRAADNHAMRAISIESVCRASHQMLVSRHRQSA